MRYVPYDPTKITYPPDWQIKAEAARKSIEAVSPDERSNEVKKHRDLWSALKPELAKITNGKCWYTESPQAGTDTDVDHFRPKSAVKDVFKSTSEKHSGYWWLALDPANFRFSCIVANRRRRDVETGIIGGKADEFPIWDEGTRAWEPNDECDIEQPLLIDPCNPAEVALITFGGNGEAVARYSKSRMRRLFEMADRSIKLYHINHSDFVKRRIEIRDKLMKYIEDARRYYKRLDAGDADTNHAYRRAIELLRETCDEKAPFSSFAIAILEPYRLDESLIPVFHK
jgi:hypothetical protein